MEPENAASQAAAAAKAAAFEASFGADGFRRFFEYPVQASLTPPPTTAGGAAAWMAAALATQSRPYHIMYGMRRRGAPAAHYMAVTVTNVARDEHVRACFDSPAAASLAVQLRAYAEQHGSVAAFAVEDFLRKDWLSYGALVAPSALRRCALKSYSAWPCAAAASGALTALSAN